MALLANMAEWMRPVLSIGWLPAALACAGALGALMADMAEARRLGVRVAAAGLGLATVASVLTALLPAGSSGSVVGSAFGLVLTGGAFAGLASAVYFTGFLTCAAGLGSVREGSRVPVAALIALAGAAGQVLLGADDVVVLFIAVEALALVAYALVSAAGTGRSDEAAARYFVQGSVATGLASLGIAVLVGLGGGASAYAALGKVIPGMAPAAALLGGILLVSMLSFKIGAFPFHSWVADAYETAPSGAAAFLASGAKAAALGGFVVLFARLMTDDPFAPTAAALRILAVASIVFGNLVALKQTSVTRMLGYSAIAQAGYALVGLAVTPVDTMLFAATYAIGACTAFLAVEHIALRSPAWDGTVAGLAGAAKRLPGASFALTVALLSMTGIPLTVGFWGKFFVFVAASRAGFVWLAVIGLLGSAVSFGYYGRVIRALYIDAAAGESVMAETGTAASVRAPLWPSLAGALCVVAFGVAPLVGGLSLVYSLFML